jgi:hypothetical protein
MSKIKNKDIILFQEQVGKDDDASRIKNFVN